MKSFEMLNKWAFLILAIAAVALLYLVNMTLLSDPETFPMQIAYIAALCGFAALMTGSFLAFTHKWV